MRGQRAESAHPWRLLESTDTASIGGHGVRGRLLVRLVRVWWQMGERENDLGEEGTVCWCPASDGQTRGGDRRSHGVHDPWGPRARQASARILTLPSRGGALPSPCLFPHPPPANTRVVVKTEQGPWLHAWYRAPCWRTVVALPQGPGGSRWSEGDSQHPPTSRRAPLGRSIPLPLPSLRAQGHWGEPA